ncbi:hypothetical protein D3C75_649250 [compost metagenome]
MTHLGTTKAFLYLLPSRVGVREYADPLHAALPMTSQDGELCDDQGRLPATGTRRHVHGIHGLQKISTGLVQSLQPHQLNDPVHIGVGDGGNQLAERHLAASSNGSAAPGLGTAGTIVG